MRILALSLFFFVSCLVSGQTLHRHFRELPCVNKEFNIYVHAVYNFDRKTVYRQEIQDAIDKANIMFEPICIKFKLCEMDTVFDYNFSVINSNSEVHKLTNIYSVDNRINIYTVSEIELDGYSLYGKCIGRIDSLKNSNILLAYIYSLSHELGHFFGLLNTFEGSGKELVDGSNCLTEGDKICDTPADPYIMNALLKDYIKNCEFISLKTDAHGQLYQPDVGNVMSGYFCDCGFTVQQYLRMVENYNNAKNKHW